MTQTVAIDRTQILDVDLYGAVKRDPYKYYVEWNQRPPFFILSDGHPQAVFTRSEDTKVVLEDYQRFSSVKRPYPGTEGFYFFNSMPSVTDSDPPVHTRRRRLMMPALTPRKLAKIEVGVNVAVDKILDKIRDKIAENGQRFDLITDLGTPLAMNTLLGLVCELPEQDWPIFTDLAKAQRLAFNQLAGNAAGKEAYQKAWAAAQDYCAELIESRRRAPVDDLVSNMLAAQSRDESQLTSEEVMATLMILFSAGLGGVTVTPAQTLWRLARNPDQMQLLLRDPTLITGAITESLRMDPSSYASLRYTVGNFEFAGLRLTDGMPVHTLSAGGNYDPRKYPDPLRFDITRPTDWMKLTSFGHGVHHCIGNAVARMGARITVGKTVQRFPKLRLENPDVMPQIEGVLKQRAPVSIPVLVN
jgi:cytochrome P450